MRTRITVKQTLVVVALAAAVIQTIRLATISWQCEAEAGHYEMGEAVARANRHTYEVELGDRKTAGARLGTLKAGQLIEYVEHSARWASYYGKMKERYKRAATRPWEGVGPAAKEPPRMTPSDMKRFGM